MPTKAIRTLSPRQIDVLKQFPQSGVIHPAYWPKFHDKSYLRTWQALEKKGLISQASDHSGWVAHWGRVSIKLYEEMFPRSTRRTLDLELQRLNDMALDFSEGSNANFMRQITVVKNLRELLIKAEGLQAA